MATNKIEKKLIHFNSESAFTTAETDKRLKDTSIVFVGDHATAIGKKIVTHGETYYTSYTGENGIDTSTPGVIRNKSEHILFFPSIPKAHSYFQRQQIRTGDTFGVIFGADIVNTDWPSIETIAPAVIYIESPAQLIYITST